DNVKGGSLELYLKYEKHYLEEIRKVHQRENSAHYDKPLNKHITPRIKAMVGYISALTIEPYCMGRGDFVLSVSPLII
ncbi:MAG: hypothetical protein LBC61_00075, partial [Candidatus Peribacteria bacterium]|nr:hypothetical protein [Candidatus Peribacteria bacterium]